MKSLFYCVTCSHAAILKPFVFLSFVSEVLVVPPVLVSFFFSLTSQSDRPGRRRARARAGRHGVLRTEVRSERAPFKPGGHGIPAKLDGRRRRPQAAAAALEPRALELFGPVRRHHVHVCGRPGGVTNRAPFFCTRVAAVPLFFVFVDSDLRWF